MTKKAIQTKKTNNQNFYFSRVVNFLFFSSLVVTLYYLLVVLLLPVFVDPQIQRFEKYEKILNWELPQHARGDFDGDGKEDLVSFTGCAFFSLAEADNIPEKKRCTATGIAMIAYPDQSTRIGQKYIDTDVVDLNLAFTSNTVKIVHSYIAKNKNENWKLFVNSNNGMRVYELGNDSILRESHQSLLVYKLNEVLYRISRLSTLLITPLLPLFFILSPLSALIAYDFYFELVFLGLACLTSVLYVFKRILGKKDA